MGTFKFELFVTVSFLIFVIEEFSGQHAIALLLQTYNQALALNWSTVTLSSAWNWFVHADALVGVVVLTLIFIFYCYFGSIIFNNYSQVDKLWSIMPIFYAWYFAAQPLLSGESTQLDQRMVIMAVLATLWGVRLSYNFGRKGGYTWHGEDYRWQILRDRLGLIGFQLLNITFIAVIQNIIITWFVVPMYFAWLKRGTPLNTIDHAATGAFVFFLLMETVADQQQWNFQQAKAKLVAAKKPLTGEFSHGFIHTGLFRYSRHPNFFAEQAMWWCFFVFSLAVTQPSYWNWTGYGTLLLTALFQGSTPFTEQISIAKYPQYKNYQKAVSRLLPMPHGSWPEENDAKTKKRN
jgi:steroid 5-alpha reductase family enzyme